MPGRTLWRVSLAPGRRLARSRRPAAMRLQDTIDFADIDPTKMQRPTYSGTASGGTLTVTDGSHTANIALLGNYIASTFVTSSDGHGGTNVVDPSATETSQTSLLVQPHHA